MSEPPQINWRNSKPELRETGSMPDMSAHSKSPVKSEHASRERIPYVADSLSHLSPSDDRFLERTHLKVPSDCAREVDGSVQTSYLKMCEEEQRMADAHEDEATPSPYLRPGFKQGRKRTLQKSNVKYKSQLI